MANKITLRKNRWNQILLELQYLHWFWNTKILNSEVEHVKEISCQYVCKVFDFKFMNIDNQINSIK